MDQEKIQFFIIFIKLYISILYNFIVNDIIKNALRIYYEFTL